MIVLRNSWLHFCISVTVAFCVMSAIDLYRGGLASRATSAVIVWPNVTSSVTSELRKRARIPRCCPLNCKYGNWIINCIISSEDGLIGELKWSDSENHCVGGCSLNEVFCSSFLFFFSPQLDGVGPLCHSWLKSKSKAHNVAHYCHHLQTPAVQIFIQLIHVQVKFYQSSIG